ncbi:hypothetical protein TNCV_3910371 [Trichonephila clavipes]|nr:hypothetical protein TNCV_3910371 [Trichonephila clavipes]
MIGQLATCDDRRPCIGLGLLPYTIITHSAKRRLSVELLVKDTFTSNKWRNLEIRCNLSSVSRLLRVGGLGGSAPPRNRLFTWDWDAPSHASVVTRCYRRWFIASPFDLIHLKRISVLFEGICFLRILTSAFFIRI